jgi:rhodanese-related sulfurtransferase
MATLITPEQARNIGHAVVDVREFPEYAAGAIRGSRLVPLSTVESEASKWNKHEPVLLVCRSGKRATQAAETLERLGFQNVTFFRAGSRHGKPLAFLHRSKRRSRGHWSVRSGQSPEAW